MSSTMPRKARLQAFLDRVWSAGDIEACDAYLADRYLIRHDPGDPWEGQTLDLEGFKHRVRTSRAPFPDRRFEVQSWHPAEDSIAITWLWSATHAGDIPGFPATGKTLEMSGATVYFFDEADRITGHWQVTDRLGIFRQLQKNLQP